MEQWILNMTKNYCNTCALKSLTHHKSLFLSLFRQKSSNRTRFALFLFVQTVGGPNWGDEKRKILMKYWKEKMTASVIDERLKVGLKMIYIFRREVLNSINHSLWSINNLWNTQKQI